MSEHRGLRFSWFARAPAAFWPVRDQLVQLLCKQEGEITKSTLKRPDSSLDLGPSPGTTTCVNSACLWDFLNLYLLIYEMASYAAHSDISDGVGPLINDRCQQITLVLPLVGAL